MVQTDILQELKRNEHLQAVPEAQLQWLVDHAEIRQYAAGESIFRKGDAIDKLSVLLEGRTRIYMMQGNQQVEYGESAKGDISGVLPYSRLNKANGNGMAVEDSTLLQLHRDHFPEMIQTQHELTETLVHQMLNRVRDFTKFQQQNEKMISLGKLSAGLAHELNNPAAAVVRSADALKKHLANVPDKFKQIISMRLTAEQVDRVNEMLFAKLQQGAQNSIPLMEKTSREDDLTDWMEDHGMQDVYEIAEIFVEYSITPDDLDFVNEEVSDEYLSPVLNWLCNVLTTEKMVSEISEASSRIGNLVKAIKEYSHMDGGADKKKVNLREGIQSTLTILQHKLKSKHVDVQIAAPETAPQALVNPGEMNQVWTNLIDNAIDAMADGGQLRIEFVPNGAFVLTNIIDNGSGIPPEIINQIFDPFFTTKEVGKGTGLGLEIANSIVRQHNGKIKVTSQPGRTEFSVCLPVD
jgi:signal transduction histidine kinase